MSQLAEDLTGFTDRKRELLGDYGAQAVGHFFFRWDEESAPAVLAPYKYRICEKQHGSAYSEISQYLLDREFEIADLLNLDDRDLTESDEEYLKEIGQEVARLIEAIDEQD